MAKASKGVQKPRASMRRPDQRLRWWETEPENCWKEVFATVDGIRDRQKSRTESWKMFRAFYENRGTGTPLGGGRLPIMAADGRLSLNVIRSCVSTAAAKIAKEKPRPLFLTSNADFSLQQQAEKLTRYIDGAFEAAKMYACGQDAFVDSCVYGTGALRLFIDGEEPERDEKGKATEDDERTVGAERVLIDELAIDDREAVYGKPLQIHLTRTMARDRLIALYPEHREAILSAPAFNDPTDVSGEDADLIQVTESWHKRTTRKTQDGVYAVTINIMGGTLRRETWEKDEFPFIFLHWSRPLTGFWGTGLAEELLGIQKEINRLLRDIHTAQKNAVPTIFVESSSEVDTDHLDNNPQGRIVKYKGQPPVFSSPAAMNPEMYQHLERLYAWAYEITGISQLSAGSKKPPGLDSGVALREYLDIETERFVLQGQRYETFYMDGARLNIDLQRDIYRDNPKLKVKARAKWSSKFITTIPWNEVDLREDQYEMQVWPVSQMPRTPAGRMQFISELMDKQDENGKPMLSGAMALQLLRMPDIDDFTDLRTAKVNVVRMQVDEMLTGGPYTPPLPFMDLDFAIEFGQLSIMLAMINGVPDSAIETLMQYVNQALIFQTPPAAPETPDPMALPPGMAPPPMPPPGPPGMPPMPPGIPQIPPDMAAAGGVAPPMAA